MPGCCRRPPACASRLKRATASAISAASRYSERIVLIATRRSMTGSKPSYTIPIAPLPSARVTRYLPIDSGTGGGIRASLPLDELQRLLQAAAHAVERGAEDADLVLALAELGHVEIALRDLVRGSRHP